MTTSGQVVFATAQATGLTWQTGPGTTLRATFVASGVLPNTQDAAFRAISDNTPAFGFASALGVLKADGTASTPVVYAVGHYRELAIQWVGLGGTYPDRPLFFQTQWPGLIPSVRPLSPLLRGCHAHDPSTPSSPSFTPTTRTQSKPLLLSTRTCRARQRPRFQRTTRASPRSPRGRPTEDSRLLLGVRQRASTTRPTFSPGPRRSVRPSAFLSLSRAPGQRLIRWPFAATSDYISTVVGVMTNQIYVRELSILSARRTSPIQLRGSSRTPSERPFSQC